MLLLPGRNFHLGAESRLFERFRAYLIEQTQINGNFYRGGIKAGPCASITASMRQPQPEYLPWTPVP